ncbi:MAG TPA: Gfo/Idh/MocA family oxidoreductase [Candidatus Baltobacteraceae bacterium]|jgi:predicted dehydrogenase|nr:Gfo/Idh/MocA family oxidoreductase [Candidatus Baltobacteraceae bacterium]
MIIPSVTSRRQFLKTSALAGGALIAPAILHGQSAAPGDGPTLKIGLIGCGGRGTGSASQALNADKNVVLTAMADVFEDKLKASLESLRGEVPDKIKVAEDHCFVGLDAFQKVIDSGVDVVLLATPPGFRPQHLKAAVAAGKHIFCEKPVATDAAGLRSVLESVAQSKQKNLALVAGFCWRYNLAERALFQRILDGQIGNVRVVYGTYYTGSVRPMPPASQRLAGMGDLEWQLRNWYNFGWLSGDGYVEQAVHAVDWMCWAMRDEAPEKAVAVGGRQIPAEGGNIFDHFEVNYEFAGGARGFLASRQQAGCANDNTATIFGTEGEGREMGFAGMPFIRGKRAWRYAGPRPNMYQVEHDELFASIRSGAPINDGDRLARSTLAAIMGRMAAYTGQEVTWDMALNSKEELVPANIAWDTPIPVPPIARPGETQFI